MFWEISTLHSKSLFRTSDLTNFANSRDDRSAVTLLSEHFEGLRNGGRLASLNSVGECNGFIIRTAHAAQGDRQ
jgi:hypothetical protein